MHELKNFKVACHADNICKDSTFVAIKGMQFDGINYIPNALARGASTIVVTKGSVFNNEIKCAVDKYKPSVIEVSDCRQALSRLSAQAYDYPGNKLNIIGITGTKGKTTSAYVLYHLLSTAGFKSALITGVKNIIGGVEYKSELTTPHPDYLHAFFNECVQQQVKFVIMEASAQGFSLQRLHDIQFAAGIFTNFDLEHSEFYSSMDDYYQAKCQMFKQLKPNAPFVVNVDNDWGKKISDAHEGFIRLSLDTNASDYAYSGLPAWQASTDKMHSLGMPDEDKANNIDICDSQKSNKQERIIPTLRHPECLTEGQTYRGIADYAFAITKNDSSGLEFEMSGHKFVCPNLVGVFNAYNLAGVVSLALQMDISVKTIQRALLSFSHVPGRMERYKLSNGAIGVIDYAHNPSSFTSVLSTLRSMTNNLIVVFGCGGSRDKTKRPIMGDIASTIADKVIITSDNPRFENLEDIIQQIYNGVKAENINKVEVVVDRASAIEHAYKNAQAGSIIAILGKGPDEYEMIGNEKFYFSDKETILKYK
jgi:UDP-N-acetylmuramoyl-L-alanyl-D-glutamate--2,6-diaminopimelate ligase